MTKSAHAPAPPSFEAALGELESIVQNMENGQLNLEDSLAAYQRGMGLLKHCRETLTNAERKIAVLEGEQLVAMPASSAGDAS